MCNGGREGGRGTRLRMHAHHFESKTGVAMRGSSDELG